MHLLTTPHPLHTPSPSIHSTLSLNPPSLSPTPGTNTPNNRRISTNTRHGSIFGGGGGGYRTPPTTQGLDLKASILSNLQNEKANKRKAKRIGRRTFG